MSILQEYNKHHDYIDTQKMSALIKYLKNFDLDYAEVVYNKYEWQKFEKWYKTIYNNKYGRGTKGNSQV